MTGTYGQDWASYQPEQPSTAGLAFVFVKATEGTGYVNPRGAAQVAHVRAAGLVVGHYHYPHMAADPAAEADRFLAVAQPQPGDLLVLDWEGYDSANSGVSFSRQIAYKKAFLAHVQAARPHHQVGTYCNTDYLARDPSGPYGDFLWIATANRAAGQPGIGHDWLIHQYGATPVDKDYCPLTVAQLTAWAHAKEDDMPLNDADAQKVWGYSHGDTPDVHQTLADAASGAAAAAAGVKALTGKVDALATRVASLTSTGLTPEQITAIANAVADVNAARLAH